MKSLSLVVRNVWLRLKFWKTKSNFKVKVRRIIITVQCKRSSHKEYNVQYESPITSGKKVMTKVNLKVTIKGPGDKVNNHSTMWKVLWQGIHMCNIKALSLLVRKSWPRCFKSRSNFKVKVTRSKMTVPCEMFCHKKYSCAMWKPHHFWYKSYAQG